MCVFIPHAYEPETKTKRPALAVFGRNRKGQITSAQLTYLDPQTAGKAPDLTVKKRSQGVIKDSFVVLQKHFEAPLYVAEGVETALSIKQAGVQGSIIAALGVSNMRKSSCSGGSKSGSLR